MRKPNAPTDPPPCTDCGAPSIQRQPRQAPRCERCAAIARDIANQKAIVLVQTIRALNNEREQEGRAA